MSVQYFGRDAYGYERFTTYRNRCSSPRLYIPFEPDISKVTEYCNQLEDFLPDPFLPYHELSFVKRMRTFHDRNTTCCRNCYQPPPPKVKDQSEYHRYFLTLTWNRKACTEAEWRDACDLFLQSKLFKHGVYAYETGSKGNNPHCHLFAFCQSKLCHNAKDPKHPIEKYKGTSHLKKFNYKYGFIKFEVVTKDNGIENYISKESPKQYFSNTTDSVHPLQPWPSQPEHPEPSSASSAASAPPSSDEE